MKKIIFLCIGILLFGANLINVNFFDGKNKLDILFSLDDSFKGKVKRISKNSYVLTNIKTDKIIQKEFKKSFINSVIISPDKEGVKIDITSSKAINTSVALTPDGYGVRFRVVNKAILMQNKPQNIHKITSKREGLDTLSYVVGVLILFILAFVLWFVKKKTINFPILKEHMKVLAQKNIDPKNRVVLFEYQNRKYLMLIGNTNVLLDVFIDDISVPKNEAQFDEMLKLTNKYGSIEKYIQNAEKLKEFDEKV